MIDLVVPRLLHEIDPLDPGWVLVHEAETTTRNMIHLLLRQLTPMPVALCHSAKVATGLLQQRSRPTLAICGVRFNDDSGPSVLRALRARFEGSRTRVILLSAMPRNRVGEVIAEFHPFETLHKPVALEDLQRTLCAALGTADDSLELSQELLEDVSLLITGDVDISGEFSIPSIAEDD